MLAPTDPRGLRSIVALRDYAVGDTVFENETAHIADTVNVTYAFPAVQADFIATIVGASIFSLLVCAYVSIMNRIKKQRYGSELVAFDHRSQRRARHPRDRGRCLEDVYGAPRA